MKDIAYHADFIRNTSGGSTFRICPFERRRYAGVTLS